MCRGEDAMVGRGWWGKGVAVFCGLGKVLEGSEDIQALVKT